MSYKSVYENIICDWTIRDKTQKLKEWINSLPEVDAKDEKGETALMVVVFGGERDLAQELLKRGADIDVKEDEKGFTSLLMNAGWGHTNSVEFLLKNGANANTQNKKGETALMLASLGGYVDTIKVLREYGANADIKNNEGQTALDYAKRGKEERYLANPHLYDEIKAILGNNFVIEKNSQESKDSTNEDTLDDELDPDNNLKL